MSASEPFCFLGDSLDTGVVEIVKIRVTPIV